MLVGVFVAVDGGDVGEAGEVGGGLLVGWLEVLAVAAPGGVELEDLAGVLVVGVGMGGWAGLGDGGCLGRGRDGVGRAGLTVVWFDFAISLS